MSVHALRYRLRSSGMATPWAWLLLAAVGAWACAVIAAFAFGRVVVPRLSLVAFGVPVALVALAVLRPSAPPWRWAAGLSALVLGAFFTALKLEFNPMLGLAIPVVLVSAVVFARRPAAGAVLVFAISGAYGSLAAFLGLRTGPWVDVVLAGLWIAAIWGFTLGRRAAAARPWPGTLAVALYVVVSLGGAFASDDLHRGLLSFRASTWYIAALLLIAYGPWRPGMRARIARGIVAVAALVGAYAVFRMIVGPSAAERTYALQSTYTNQVGGELGLVGSFPSRHELAGWCAVVIPFAAMAAVTFRGRWRLISIVAAATCTVAMLDTNVRASLVALVAAVALALVLYQFSRGFEGLHLGVTALVLAVIAIGGTGAYLYTTSGSGTARSRFSSVLNPSRDAAYEARQFKWDSALTDIAQHPLGHGLGTAGRVQIQYGRFVSLTSKDIDSSYLKIAWEQGFAVMVFFVVAMLLLLYGLARGAVGTRERQAAGLAVGACGSLVALLVLFFAGVYIEGLTALAGWTIVGVGAGPFATPER